MSLPPYPKYKDSGVEWLGEVPEHWDVWKLSHAIEQIGSGTTPKTDNLAYYDGGETAWVNTGDLNDAELFDCERRVTELALHDNSSLKVYPARSLIIAMYGATIGKLGMLRFPAAVNQACCVFSNPLKISNKFLFHWFSGFREQIVNMASGGGQPNISQEILRSLRVPCPGMHEQDEIAAFLDREAGKINALVAEQQRLIGLLKEKRQALISHAVTKGLNPDAPMKDSGIEWLGQVPAHWAVSRLRFLFRQEKRQDQVGKPVLSVYRDYGVILKDSRDDNMNKTPEDLSLYQLVNQDDLVVNKMKAWQGSLGVSALEGITSPDYVVFTPHHQECSDFLHLLLRSQSMVSIYRSISNGIRPAQWRLEPDSFLELRIFLPPVQEQKGLVSFITFESSRFDALMAEATHAIELLQERRTALISAAVTGKIDVRGIAAEDAA
jgi:restriction endonuclease S subunit